MTHVTISGHTIELSPSTPVRRVLEELQRMLEDATVREPAMVAYAYAPTNPILDATVMPGHGSVTARVLDDPAYQVMTDLLYRKSLAVRDVDPEEIAAQFTVTVPEAAEQLGVHQNAVRQAIYAKRLPSWVKEGKHYLRRDSLKAFAPERRGPRPESRLLQVLHGSNDGRVLKMKSDLPLSRSGKMRDGFQASDLPAGWTSAIVLTVDKPDKQRAFLLVPSATEERLEFPPFFVKGRFRIEEKINNSREARRAWETFGKTDDRYDKALRWVASDQRFDKSPDARDLEGLRAAGYAVDDGGRIVLTDAGRAELARLTKTE